MKQGLFEIIENTRLTDTVWRMRLKGDTSAITGPGQFVNIQLDGLFLRRPISVCDCEGDVLTIVYKVVGKGTRQMSDGYQIRRYATDNNVTIFTALDTVKVLLDVLEETTLTISTIDA